MTTRNEDLGDPFIAAQAMQDGVQARMWTALPGIVQSVDMDAQTCTVQPTIRGVVSNRDNELISQDLPLLPDVPILWPRAGGFAVTVPLQAGDEVLVVFASRCVDAWWSNGGIGEPMEARMHDLSDGFAIPGPCSRPRALSNVQMDGVELRTEDRSTFLRVTNGTIFIKGNIVHEGNVAHTGNVLQTGNLAVTGALTNNGKNVGSTHTHTGSPTAPNGPVSNTGAPT